MAEPQAYDDDFLDEDEFLDPAEVERRLLSDEAEEFGDFTGFDEPAEDAARPFGSGAAKAAPEPEDRFE